MYSLVSVHKTGLGFGFEFHDGISSQESGYLLELQTIMTTLIIGLMSGNLDIKFHRTSW